ncbi:MAG: phosphoribosylformylglycinamidine synthase [Bacteroidales bacterium]|nr:phosphoribosylformylglycinamidine synthase [Candidatus Colimorpha onthohippi]
MNKSSAVRRLYVEKKTDYAIKAHELQEELTRYLGIHTKGVRILVRYDIENITERTFQQAKATVFSEPPVDNVYEEAYPHDNQDFCFSVEFLPGQYDQRADSAEQCVRLLCDDEQPTIHTALTYVISGQLDSHQRDAIMRHCINPVDSRLTEEVKPMTLTSQYEEPSDVHIFDGFQTMDDSALRQLYDSLGLAMTLADMQHIQRYFRDEEHRDPTMTEIRVLDTYWSDHCRHTTFATELTDIQFEDGCYKTAFEQAFQDYLIDHKKQYKDRTDKYVCLMDLGTLAAKRIKAEGGLEDQEPSDEINACSIVVPLTVNGHEEEWLVNFKNETHNHPTEIEPYGGAATCLGGCIRDPLSGRTYVYQAMRVTGAADPTKPLSQTIEGKLPQRKIVTTAARGYSSYGNQIGLATGLVNEVYHPDYVAKRMEIGAVIAAAPRRCVKRLSSDPGDIIILLGGRTGRDGCGGATGASKAHTTSSLTTCGAEVQKGNAPTERKIQRLFRREEVSALIKKCNDFGAGGVSVAIGELADGLQIDLDRVPKKYAGLDGTEISISESQERMAVVVDPKDADQMLRYADQENLEAVVVAAVTKEPRMVIKWRGKAIVNLSRRFIDTNGAHQATRVVVEHPHGEKPQNRHFECANQESYVSAWKQHMGDLNICSQKGLVEMFDSSIGAGTVVMPYGGQTQSTPTQSMIAKIPMLHGEQCNAVTIMSYGFDPYLSKWSPYHGAQYAVIHSVAKILAAGGDYRKIRLTFQEYFKRLGTDPKRWGEPLAALLGAYKAQRKLGLPAIGGKDSMSGTFNDIDVPPTLVSFAVCVSDIQHVITPELKGSGHQLWWLPFARTASDEPNYTQMHQYYSQIAQAIEQKQILSAYAIGNGGVLESLAKMAFGNRIGIRIDHNDIQQLTIADYGGFVVEVADQYNPPIEHICIGQTIDTQEIQYHTYTIQLDELHEAWSAPLETVFPTRSNHAASSQQLETKIYQPQSIYICKHKTARPHVFIPVFPGTNCEYDTAQAFERAGATTETIVLRNQNASQIRQSVEAFTQAINQSQIVMLPGGFSAGDEPDGSAKFITSVFRNPAISDAVMELLHHRDGLMLGICNGFQALVKLGLVPYGEIRQQDENSPTLTYNTIGRHQSMMSTTRVVSKLSPWLQLADTDQLYRIPISHGEGRFVAPKTWINQLFQNGQVATQYVDPQGTPTMQEPYNMNGSYYAIEGITSPDGRVLGKMAHSERQNAHTAINVPGPQDQKIFESGVKYFL